jgi:hypothetical protein
MKKLRKDHS